jgi:hypothetical protein
MWHGAGVAAVVRRALALDPASRPGADLVLALVLAPDLALAAASTTARCPGHGTLATIGRLRRTALVPPPHRTSG